MSLFPASQKKLQKNSEMFKLFIRIIRPLLAVSILGGLFYFVGAYELISVFFNLDWFYVFVLILLSPVLIWVSCLKWQLFIREGGNEVPISHLMKLYTMGFFFSIFTPSTVGGDVARSYHLGRYLSSQSDALVATFLERLTGLLAMAFLGLMAVVFGRNEAAELVYAILGVSLLTFSFSAIFFIKPLGVLCFKIVKSIISLIRSDFWKDLLIKWCERIEKSMVVIHNNYSLFFKAMLLSLLFHACTVVNTYVSALAIGWHEPNFLGMFIVVPLVLLIGIVPLTPSNFGITEGAFLFFLQRIGASKGQALAIALVIRAKVVLIAMLGGLFWLQIRKMDKRD